MRRADRSRQCGFTLVELVVTMTVLVLLAFAVVPSVGDWIVTTRVRNSASSLQAGLQKARTEALRRNKNVTFWMVAQADQRIVDNGCGLSTGSGSWVVSIDDPTGLCGVTDETIPPTLIEAHPAGDGGTNVTVAAFDAGNNGASSITFNGFGQAVAIGTGGAAPISVIDLTAASGGRRLRVQISSGGGVRMCDRDVANTDPRSCVAAS